MAGDPTRPGFPSVAHHAMATILAAHSQPPDTLLGPNPAEDEPFSQILFEEFFLQNTKRSSIDDRANNIEGCPSPQHEGARIGIPWYLLCEYVHECAVGQTASQRTAKGETATTAPNATINCYHLT